MGKELVNNIIKAKNIANKISDYWIGQSKDSGLTEQEALQNIAEVGQKLKGHGSGTFQSRVAVAVKENLERHCFEKSVCPECYSDSTVLDDKGFRCEDCSYQESME